MARYKISNRVSHLLIFYLLVFDIIHDAMCLNKMSRTSSRNIGPQNKKYSSTFNSFIISIPKIRNIPIFRLAYSIKMYRDILYRNPCIVIRIILQ